MEHFSHKQNLAYCRRQLAEAELATPSDEIRHSMLMRLLAEEEAHGLLIADDGDRPSLAMNEFAETATQLADDDFVQSPAEMNVGLAAKEKPAGLRRRALINSLAV